MARVDNRDEIRRVLHQRPEPGILAHPLLDQADVFARRDDLSHDDESRQGQGADDDLAEGLTPYGTRDVEQQRDTGDNEEIREQRHARTQCGIESLSCTAACRDHVLYARGNGKREAGGEPDRVDHVACAVVVHQSEVAVNEIGDELAHRTNHEDLQGAARALRRSASQNRRRGEDDDEIGDGERDRHESVAPRTARREGRRPEREVPREHRPADQDRRDVEPELGPFVTRARGNRERQQASHPQGIRAQRDAVDPDVGRLVMPNELEVRRSRVVRENAQRGSGEEHPPAPRPAAQPRMTRGAPRQGRRHEIDREVVERRDDVAHVRRPPPQDAHERVAEEINSRRNDRCGSVIFGPPLPERAVSRVWPGNRFERMGGRLRWQRNSTRLGGPSPSRQIP